MRNKWLSRAKDLDKLHYIVHEIVGQECWSASLGYGGELLLDLGSRHRCDHPTMTDEEEGEWMFGTCGTPWSLQTPEGTFCSSEIPKKRVQRVKSLERHRVTRFRVSDEALTISFDGDRSLHVTPTDDDDQFDVPYWELFMPNKMYIAFGPNGTWSYKPSDLPMSQD